MIEYKKTFKNSSRLIILPIIKFDCDCATIKNLTICQFINYKSIFVTTIINLYRKTQFDICSNMFQLSHKKLQKTKHISNQFINLD